MGKTTFFNKLDYNTTYDMIWVKNICNKFIKKNQITIKMALI